MRIRPKKKCLDCEKMISIAATRCNGCAGKIKFQNPEYKEKVVKILNDNRWTWKGMKRDEAFSKMLSHALKGRKKPPRTPEHIRNLTAAITGRKATLEHRLHIRDAHRKRAALGLNNFSGNGKPTYAAVHLWLHKYHGKANKCDNPKCTILNPYRYEWALLHGNEYEKKRENFWQLCVKCHRDYDETNPWQLAINPRANVQKLLRGRMASEDQRAQ